MKLILIRGASGSGKSTMARRYVISSFHPCTIFETDHFFSDNGRYFFDKSLLHDAHKWCFLSVKSQMLVRRQIVVVANTFTQLWEMQPYLDLAKEFGYEVEILTTPRPWDAQELFRRNVHGVPLEVIERQIKRFEE